MNPECAAGKCRNCDGLAVDDHNDLVACGCTCHDRPRPHATTCAMLVRHRECDCQGSPAAQKPAQDARAAVPGTPGGSEVSQAATEARSA